MTKINELGAAEQLVVDEQPSIVDLPRPQPGACALVGPPSSGKTSFLLAIASAFERERRPDWSRFVPGPRLADLITAATNDSTATAAVESTTAAATYSFQLGLSGGAAAVEATPEEVEVSVLDTSGVFFSALAGEGGAELDSAALVDLIRATRNSRCLVLCVAAEPAQSEHLQLVGLIDRLVGGGEGRVSRLGAKAWPHDEPPWQRTARRELPFERVLVLLTHIEGLCTATAEAMARSDAGWRDVDPLELKTMLAYGRLEAREVAEMLDVPAILRQRVVGLETLRASLKPGARLAVSAVGSQGFAVSPETASDGGPWLPFGIWPVVLFMATGRVVAPLTLVTGRNEAALDLEYPQ